jgi:hypothetical protein
MRISRFLGAAGLAVALFTGLLVTANGAAAAEGDCPDGNAAISAFSFSINGGPAVSTMEGNVQSGDTVQANFTIADGCEGIEVSLAAYMAPSAAWSIGNADKQVLYDSGTGTFAAGEHNLTVDVPQCHYQTDFVRGAVIDHLSPPDQLYGAQGRLLDHANGGHPACQQPSAAVNASCHSQGGVVSLTNAGPQPVDFQVQVNDAAPTTVTVAGNSSATHDVGLAEGETATITVSAPGMDDVVQSVTLDCQKPAAAAANSDCAKSGIDVSLTNTAGESPVTFSIQKGSGAPVSVEVPAGGSTTHNVAVGEDETATITVTAPGMTTLTKTVTRNCVEDVVEGNIQTPTGGGDVVKGAVLARTGPLGDTGLLTLVGLALLASGSVLVRRSRRVTA